jgi:hypothetical protein
MTKPSSITMTSLVEAVYFSYGEICLMMQNLTFHVETFRNYFSCGTGVILDSSKTHSSWSSKIYSSVVNKCSVKVPGKIIIPNVLEEVMKRMHVNV